MRADCIRGEPASAVPLYVLVASLFSVLNDPQVWRRSGENAVATQTHPGLSRVDSTTQSELGLCGLEVDDQLELRRQLNRNIAGLGAFEDLTHLAGSTPKLLCDVRTVNIRPPASTNSRKPYIAGSRTNYIGPAEERAAVDHSMS